MSDYLWDKSGEPDAEVGRLEDLLGSLRNTRGAPELPFEVEARASTRAGLFRSAIHSRPARLAAAAALLLAVLAGALVMLRQSKTDEGGRASAADETRSAPRQTAATKEARAPAAPKSTSSESAAADDPNKSTPDVQRRGAAEAAQTFPNRRGQRIEPPRESAASVRPREAFRAAASFTDGRRESRAGVARVGSEGAAFDLESRVRAKEQLVYALRLTSEALKEVRGRAAASDSRADSFDPRNPMR